MRATDLVPLNPMSVNTQIRTKNAIKALWVIYDPLDGAHVFSSEKKAKEVGEGS